MKVLTPEILKLKTKPKGGSSGNLLSIPVFIRERIIMTNARYAHKRLRRSIRLGIPVEECPFPDSIWRKYHYPSVKLDNYDVEGCDNEDMLFDFGKDLIEQSESAEMAPDSGYPVNSSFTLPRSFLLDAIHSAASLHCIHSQKQAGKPIDRISCPSPDERAKLLQGFGDRYISSLKTIFVKSKKKWYLTEHEYEGEEQGESEGQEDEDSEQTEKSAKSPENENSEHSESDDESSINNEGSVSDKENEEQAEYEYEVHPDDPDFDAILAHFLDTPVALDPVPAYDFSDRDVGEFGADGLWTFDTSSLLAFGILAEEFCSKMIEAHVKYEKEQESGKIGDLANESDDSEGVILSSDIDSDVELECLD